MLRLKVCPIIQYCITCSLQTFCDDFYLLALMLYIPVNNVSVLLGRFPVFLGLTSIKQRIKCVFFSNLFFSTQLIDICNMTSFRFNLYAINENISRKPLVMHITHRRDVI